MIFEIDPNVDWLSNLNQAFSRVESAGSSVKRVIAHPCRRGLFKDNLVWGASVEFESFCPPNSLILEDKKDNYIPGVAYHPGGGLKT